MLFALCTSLRDATTDQLKDPTYCAQYVGALWIPPFIEKMAKLGHEVIASKDLSCEQIKDAQIIQEDISGDGLAWLLMGSNTHGSVLYCLESPMYVPKFYENYDEYSKLFKKTHCYGHDNVAFPSFDVPRSSEIPWNFRRTICTVMSNKFSEHGLHPKRREAIEYFKSSKVLDLFGKGFCEIDDKIEILQHYKFTLCFENIEMPGYVTEKMIHAIQAASIPVYWGAPNVAEIIPPNLFVDASKFDSWGELYIHLYTMTYNHSMPTNLINDGQEWLKSEAGQRWTYDGFANQMVKLATESLLNESTPTRATN